MIHPSQSSTLDSQVSRDFQLLALPSPEDRPDASVVIFDGQCKICRAQIARLARLDRGGRLAYLSLHDPAVRERYPDLTHDQLMQDMYVVDRKGRRHRGAAAVRYLSGRLPRLWPLAPLLYLPCTLPLWQWLYRQVANRRYRFGRADDCDDGSCSVHARR
jgi:predicted DCC family thiol-disulfide oxidoreductase YuxK